MTHLDLFSGIGGFALAARWAGFETIQFVENEPFCQKVLAKNFKGVPIHGDIKTFKATGLVSPFLLSGGYPCQPFSQAGKRRGSSDDRHLWPEMFRIIQECRPTWVLAENVSGHIKLGLQEVLTDLESEGYDTQTFHIGAVAQDAPHRRMRLWIVAHSKYSPDRTNGGKEGEEDSIQIINRQEGLSGVSGRTGSDTENVAYSISTTSRVGAINGKISDKRRGPPRTKPESIQPGNREACSGESQSGSENVAYSSSIRCPEGSDFRGEIPEETGRTKSDFRDPASSEDVAYSKSKRVEGYRSGRKLESHTYGQEGLSMCESERPGAAERITQPGLDGTLSDGLSLWMDEPDIPRVGVGIPDRAKRLKAIGNAIVPQVAFEIMRHMKI